MLLKNRNYYKGQIPYDHLEDQEEIHAKNNHILVNPEKNSINDREILKYVGNNRENFDYYEAALINFYHLGFTLNEIAKKFNFSYNKTKRMFDNIIFKLRNVVA